MAIMCMALIGIAIMLTEIHRYMVYKAEIEQEERDDNLGGVYGYRLKKTIFRRHPLLRTTYKNRASRY